MDLNVRECLIDKARFTHTIGRYLDWVIVGGESGQKARPCDVAWIRSIAEQCHGANVPCFVKQLGARPVADSPLSVPNGMRVTASSGGTAIVLRHRKGADPAEWPADLRAREWPR